MNLKKALFLDRDGVINEDFGYVCRIDDFKFKSGIFSSLKEFQKLGYLLIIVTNQSGIGRGYYTELEFEKVSKYMLSEFKKHNINISKIYHCPHSPEELCSCRKPSPGMILCAAKEFGIDLKNSIMIGDKKSDIQAANLAGISMAYLLDNDNFFNVEDVLKELKKENIL